MSKNSISQAEKIFKEEREKMKELFPDLVNDLTAEGLNDPSLAHAYKWYKEAIEYNVPFGKKNAGISLVTTYRYFVPNPTEENLKIARVIGWALEFMAAYFQVGDDIMDKSLTRRGQPCWYTIEKVGMLAINDAFWIEASIYKLLTKHVKGQPYYMDVMELFLENNFQLTVGQCLDLTTVNEKDITTNFTSDRYVTIAEYKAAYFMYVPVAVAMHMAGMNNKELLGKVNKIISQMAYFFTAQNDYMESFVDPDVTGKIGRDIEDKKCTWVISTALGLASPKQKQTLQDNYGKEDPQCVKRVRDVFQELDIPGVFREFEDSSYKKLLNAIDAFEDKSGFPKSIFLEMTNQLYKRQR